MRTYSEAEVQAIVERQQEADAGTPEAGLTLDEIERLGREAGIDPSHLRAAAAEVDSAGRTLARQSGQTRTDVFVERWIDAPLAMAAWEDVVAHLQSAHGAPAGLAAGSVGDSVRQIGTGYEWSHTSPLGVRTRVTLTPREGRTRLRMTQLVGVSTPTAEGIGYGMAIAMAVAFVALLVAGSKDASAVTALTATAAAFLGTWVAAAPAVTVLDRRWRARKLRELDALADDLASLVRSAPGAETAGASEGPVSGPLLDLDALPDADPGADVPAGRRRTSA